MEGVAARSHRLTRLLQVSTDVAGDLDVSSVAQHIAETVPDVTDFQVASVTLRDGDQCRRIAAHGIDDRRIGMTTDAAQWDELVAERFRVGAMSYLIDVNETPQSRSWGQLPDRHEVPEAAESTENTWTQDHAMLLVLRDSHGRILGYLSVDAPQSGQLPDGDDVNALELLGHQAQAVLLNARLYQLAERQRTASETLRDVLEVVSASLELDEVLQRCCEAARAHSVGDRASIFLIEDGLLVGRMSLGVDDDALWERFRALDPIPLADAPAVSAALASDAPVVIEDLASSQLGERERDLFARFEARSAALYPLIASGQQVGVLAVDAFRRHARFPVDERGLIHQIARQAAMAIHQARLHADARDHAARVTELHELAKAMTESFDFNAIFERVSRAVRERTHSRTVTVFEVGDDEVRMLRSDLGDVAQHQLELPFRSFPRRGMIADLLDRIAAAGGLTVAVEDWPALREIVLPQTRSLLTAGHLPDGGMRVLLVAGSDDPERFGNSDVAFMRELTQLTALALRNARLYEEARYAAERDSLTGLKNRRVFWQELDWHLADLTDPIALAIIDVDDYKIVNDAHGHAVGDRVLQLVTDRIARSARHTDTLYRIGGDEFALVMPGSDRSAAKGVVERAAAAVQRSRTEIPLPTLSVGISAAPADGRHGDALFRAADAALYLAKRAGKGRTEVADSSPPTWARPGDR